MIELRCNHDLALRLGAIGPETIAHHKTLRDTENMMLIRDRVTSLPMFWAMVPEPAQAIAKSS